MGGGTKKLFSGKALGWNALASIVSPVVANTALMTVKGTGHDVPWQGEILSNPANAALRGASDDKIDTTSRESSEGAAEGAAVGGMFGGGIGSAIGAIAGAGLGTVQHYYNTENPDAQFNGGAGGVLGIGSTIHQLTDLANEGFHNGMHQPVGSGGGFGFTGGVTETGGKAKVAAGEQVGGGTELNDRELAHGSAEKKRGRLVAAGSQTFGFTSGSSPTLG